MDERVLVQKAQQGDYQAFVDLIEPHKGRLYGLARKMSGNDQDAEDIVQETFLKAIDKIDQFRGEASFGTWLYSIALNQGRSLLAGRKQTELKPVEAYLPMGSSDDAHTHQSRRLFDWQDPHKLLENRELRDIIERSLEELPYKYRSAFLLRYYEDMSIKEIVQITGESVAAAKSQVLRARLALRDKLSKAFEEKHAR